MTEQATQAAGETIDGADWPTREQRHVMEAAAVKFGSVAVERVNGTDDMRMTTPEGTVLVSEDGKRTDEDARLDYAAVERVRTMLKAEAQRRYLNGQGKYDGIAFEALTAAEGALFRAFNVLASYCDDHDARATLDA